MNVRIPQALFLTAIGLLVGCQTQTIGPGSNHALLDSSWGTGGMEGVNGNVSLGGPPAIMPAENDQALNPNDPCVNNLENLTGALLEYAGLKHRLPGSLSELPAESDGQKLSFSCPVDGKPYVYYPDGLRAPKELAPKMVDQNGAPLQGNLLILVDADAAHQVTERLTNGQKSWSEKKMVRYGIVMEPPQQGKAVKMYVIPVEQALLDMYLKEQKRDQGGVARQIAPGGAF